MAGDDEWSEIRRKFPADPGDKPKIEYAPADRMYEHPDVLEEFMRRICGLEPEEYALSDESLLSDLDTIDTDELFEAVHRVYGVNVPRRPQPYLWEIIAEIAAKRAR
jgi:hypothetical protein